MQIEALEAEHHYFVRWNRFSSRQKVHHSQEAYDERERVDTRERDDQSELLEQYYQDMLEQQIEDRYPDRYGWDQYSYDPRFD